MRPGYRLILILLFSAAAFQWIGAADRYSAGSGDWNSTTTWSAIPGGPAGAGIPTASDNVYIESNHTVSITVNSSCSSLTFTGTGATLIIASSVSLSVSGSVILDNQAGSDTYCTLDGEGSVNCAVIEVGSGSNPLAGNRDTFSHAFYSTVDSLHVAGNINLNGLSGDFKTYSNPTFYHCSGSIVVEGLINRVIQANQNTVTFSLQNSPGSGLLYLFASEPFNLNKNKDYLYLNGSSSRVVYCASANQTIQDTYYHDITLSGSGIKTFPNSGTTTIYGTLSMEGSATTGGKAPVYGPSACLRYSGTSAQTTGIEFPATFSATGGVILNNIDGLSLNSDRSISEKLVFISGKLSTGSNVITIAAGGELTGASTSSYINGILEKGIETATGEISFEIGDASSYTPVSIAFSGSTNGTGLLRCSTVNTDHPQISSANFNPDYTVNRYWSLSNNGVTGFTSYNVTFTFLSTDCDPGTSYTGFVSGRYDSGVWYYPATGTKTETSIEATGLNGFGEFQAGQYAGTYRSACSGNWEDLSSWEVFEGGAWIPATSTPGSGSNAITILNGHSLTNTAVLSIDELTIDAGGAFLLGAPVTATNGTGDDITVSGTFNCSNQVLSGNGSFLLNNNATIIICSPDGICLSGNAGNIQTLVRTFDTGANYYYSGTVTQLTGDALPSEINNLTINNPAGVGLSGSVIINGTLTLTQGTLNTGSNTLSFQNSDLPIIKGGGSISTIRSANLEFGRPGNTSGAAFTLPAGLFDTQAEINNLTIYRANTLSLNEQVISVYGTVLCNGPLITNGNLKLCSDAAGTALIDGSGTGTINGNVIMQRYLDSSFGYKYFSSPFQAAMVSEFAEEVDLTYWFPLFYSYDESRTSSGWVGYTDPAGVLEPLHGYAANLGSATVPLTSEISGEVSNGPLSLTLYNNNNTYTQGLNLVGNPYPSPIDWDAASGWTRTNIDDAVYFFRASTTDQWGGTYSSYVNGISSDGAASNIIPSMQGFFVHVSDGSYPVTATLGLNNDVRVADHTTPFLKSTIKETRPANLSLIRLLACFSDNRYLYDPATLYLNKWATANFDPNLDALKILNTDFNVPNLYFLSADNKNLSINALPFFEGDSCTIGLGLKLNRGGNLLISLTERNIYFETADISIYDIVHDTIVSLEQDNSYSVALEPGEYINRFFLVIKDISLNNPAPIFTKSTEAFTIYQSRGLLNIDINSCSGKNGMLRIYSLSGTVVNSLPVRATGHYQVMLPAKGGIYIVSYADGSGIFSKKIIINK